MTSIIEQILHTPSPLEDILREHEIQEAKESRNLGQRLKEVQAKQHTF